VVAKEDQADLVVDNTPFNLVEQVMQGDFHLLREDQVELSLTKQVQVVVEQAVMVKMDQVTPQVVEVQDHLPI
jgi:hypothetical protein